MSVETKKPLRIACFGEAMAELSLPAAGSGGEYPDKHGSDNTSKNASKTASPSLGFAGDSMNTAIYLKRLMGDSADVSYVTVVGKDPLSDALVDVLECESISTENVQRHDELNVGIYAIVTDDTGERTFSYWRSNSAARTLFQTNGNTNFDVLAEFDVVYFSAISLAVLPMTVRQSLLKALLALKSSQDVQVIFDSNYRPALWESKAIAQQLVSDAWRMCDIALPSIDDEQNLFDDIDEAALVERLYGYGITKGALKRGEDGPLSLTGTAASSNGVRPEWLDAPVTVVDTTAAGDSFNAGYLSAVLADRSQDDALRSGHACASRVIAHRGAIVPKEQW